MSDFETLAAERSALVDKWIKAKERKKICDDEIDRLTTRAAAHSENEKIYARKLRKIEEEIRESRR